MNSFDHYPFADATDSALLTSISDALALMSVPSPVAPVLPAVRYRLKYGVMECTTCGLAKEFCRGHAPAAAQSQDAARADASLEQRVRECKGR